MRTNHKDPSQVDFATRAKIMIGLSILVGLLIAIALFIGSVRGLNEILKQ